MPYSHVPVMVEEVIHYLKLKNADKVIDCTLGGGGHAKAILERISPSGKLLGIDLDPLAIKATQKEIDNFKDKLILAQDNFKNLKKISHVYQFDKVNAILFDLGLSSGQLQDQSRGFSFLAEGQLDMRFGNKTDLTAENILNNFSQQELAEIFKNYGEERLALPIAKKIVEVRKDKPITLPIQLVEIVAAIYKKYYREKSKINPATKVFQALRIAVNQELDNLNQVLPQAMNLLVKGGRLAVISYHSLEDKVAKEFFKQESRACLCPPQIPVCRCGHNKNLKIITKKPITPSDQEIMLNPRSRSAKLRVAERL